MKINSLFSDKEIISKSLSSLILKISGSLFGYFLLMLVTKNLGAAAWGEYVIFLAILNISSIFSRLGIDKLALKSVAASNKNLDEVKSIYFSSAKILLTISLIFSSLLFYFSDLIAFSMLGNPSMISVIKMVACVLPFFSIICLNESTFRGLKMIKDFAFFQQTSKMLFSVLFFLLLYYVCKLFDNRIVVYSYLLSLVLIFILSSFRVYKILCKTNMIGSLNISSIFKQSIPMMLSSSILLLMTWADSLMIGSFVGEHEVGVYNVAVKVALLTSISITAVNSITAPKLSESFNNDNLIEFKRIILYSTKLISFSTFPILLIMFLFPSSILSFFGDEFVSAKYSLLILAFSQAVGALSGSVGSILNMTGKQKVYGNILLVSLVLNIVLNYLLIPIYGIEGAAIASASSLIFWNLYSVYYVYKHYGVLTLISFKN